MLLLHSVYYNGMKLMLLLHNVSYNGMKKHGSVISCKRMARDTQVCSEAC